MAPFADYDSFESCVREHEGGVQDAESYCAAIHHEATGEWPGEKAAESFDSREEHLDALLTAAEKMDVEPDDEFLDDVREKAGYADEEDSEREGIIDRLLSLGR